MSLPRFDLQAASGPAFPPKLVTAATKAAIALAVFLAVSALPASAQIASYVDENGKRVYVNAERPLPPPHRGNGTYSNGDLERMASAVAERHSLDPALVKAVVAAESSWDPFAVSSKGAQGLMQLMPEKARELGVQDPFDPEQNLDGGARHLRELLLKYDGDINKALAAYNAGSGAVDRAGGVPNYSETKGYVRKITQAYNSPGSGRSSSPTVISRPIVRVVDASGKVVFVN